jgi:hypothetical protein
LCGRATSSESTRGGWLYNPHKSGELTSLVIHCVPATAEPSRVQFIITFFSFLNLNFSSFYPDFCLVQLFKCASAHFRFFFPSPLPANRSSIGLTLGSTKKSARGRCDLKSSPAAYYTTRVVVFLRASFFLDCSL